jgi:anti-anti-sigma factor
MSELAMETRTDGDVAHVVLRGEFDLAAVPEFETRLAALEADSPSTLVIDLSDLGFMDSSGLRALVAADARARESGRRLAIVSGPPAVRRVFEITQLDRRLDFIEDASAIDGD